MPSFSKTRTLVLLNTATLDVKTMVFGSVMSSKLEEDSPME